MDKETIQKLDYQLNWHPCSQMKDYEHFKPLVIKKAYGCYLELEDGKKIIDAISSWWCKSLGHGNALLKKALFKQVEKFEHVIFANTTNETIVSLSQKLTSIMPGLNKVFYAGDGSCAVEIALKMSLHSRIIKGECYRNRFISLKNSYHGETLGALSVSDVGIYRTPYEPILFQPHFIEPLYVSSTEHPHWEDAREYWKLIESELAPFENSATAIFVEPILQGASGMRLYSQDFLSKLSVWAKEHNIHIIADEIMTGLGRTGKMLACEHANITPDFICLSKGLTSGWMPFSAVLITNEMYNIFYDDYEKSKSFLHSHTYSGNALGAALALETINIIKNNNLCEKANDIQTIMRKNMDEIAADTKFLTNVRGIGAVIAADIVDKYSQKRKRIGYEVYQEAIKQGALLRPLGNTLYWMPPLIISDNILEELKNITHRSIRTFLFQYM